MKGLKLCKNCNYYAVKDYSAFCKKNSSRCVIERGYNKVVAFILKKCGIDGNYFKEKPVKKAKKIDKKIKKG